MRRLSSADGPAAALPETTLIRRFGRTSILAFGLQIGGVGLSYLAQLLAARLAGPDDFGLYAYATSIVIVTAYLAALGYDSAMLRFLPTYAERGAWHLVAGFVAFVERRVKIIAAAATLLGFAVIVATSAGRSLARLETFGLSLVLIPIWALMIIRCTTMRALGNVLTAQLPDRVIRDGSLTLVLALAALALPFPVDAPLLVGARILSLLCALSFATFVARRLTSNFAVGACNSEEQDLWRRIAYPFLLMVAAESLINRCGVLMLGWYGRTADAGCFALISNLACLALLPRLAVNAFLTPMIARFYARGDLAGLGNLVSKGSLWCFLGSVAIGVAIWIGSPFLLALYGPSFVDGRSALGVLILGQIVATGAEAQVQLLKMTGREIAAAKVLVGSLVCNVILCAVLIPTHGLMGAAIGNLGCLLIWSLCMTPVVWSHLRIKPNVFHIPISAASRLKTSD